MAEDVGKGAYLKYGSTNRLLSILFRVLLTLESLSMPLVRMTREREKQIRAAVLESAGIIAGLISKWNEKK